MAPWSLSSSDEIVRVCNRPGCAEVLPESRKSKRCQKCSREAAVRSEEKFRAEKGEKDFDARRHGRAARNYKKNGHKYRDRARERRATLRAEFIHEYGGVCSCCGENTPVFLTLEHLDNDGKEHRDEVGHDPGQLLRDLKRRGWPKDKYTLMCFNCNRARWVLGECPHKRKRDA